MYMKGSHLVCWLLNIYQSSQIADVFTKPQTREALELLIARLCLTTVHNLRVDDKITNQLEDQDEAKIDGIPVTA